MRGRLSNTTYAESIQLLCVVLLGVILTAGLWPFHAPLNDVRWLQKGNGLYFGEHGTVLSSGNFSSGRARPGGAKADTSCTLEILLQPGQIRGEGTLLAFDSSADPSFPFSLRQLGASLAVQRHVFDDQGIARRPWLKVDHILRAGELVLVTITSGRHETVVYVDGVRAGESSTLGLVSTDLTGQLVLATSTVDDGWTGQIMGLAVYDRSLTAEQVGKHFASWRSDQGPALVEAEDPVAVYLFNEHGGNVVHNRRGPGPDLTIPTHYSVLHPPFLRAAWAHHHYGRAVWARWSFWQDVFVNIAGFIPVGFLLVTYFTSVRPVKRPVLFAILLGIFLSFSIEGLQVFLPTRDSDVTDIITNTTGTCLGVVLCRISWMQALWVKTLSCLGCAAAPSGSGAIKI